VLHKNTEPESYTANKLTATSNTSIFIKTLFVNPTLPDDLGGWFEAQSSHDGDSTLIGVTVGAISMQEVISCMLNETKNWRILNDILTTRTHIFCPCLTVWTASVLFACVVNVFEAFTLQTV
jgi:hypothetical protein